MGFARVSIEVQHDTHEKKIGQNLLELCCLTHQLKVILNPPTVPRTLCAVFCFLCSRKEMTSIKQSREHVLHESKKS